MSKNTKRTETADTTTGTQVIEAEASTIQDATPTVSLNPEEKAMLKKHEATIEGGLNTFQEVGMAFADIRDRGLYREHGTFDEYCQKVWKVNRSKAYRYMAAAKCVKQLKCSQMATKEPLAIPTTEKKARKMAGLKPDEQVEVAKKVAQKTHSPTAKDFDEEVDKFVEEERPRVKACDTGSDVEEDPTVIATPHPKPTADMVPMVKIAERIKAIYNIYCNSSRKQDGLRMFGELERWVGVWVDWEAKDKEPVKPTLTKEEETN